MPLRTERLILWAGLAAWTAVCLEIAVQLTQHGNWGRAAIIQYAVLASFGAAFAWTMSARAARARRRWLVLAVAWQSARSIEAAAGDELPPVIASPIEPAPPAADLAIYAGSYADPNLGEVTLSVEGTHLAISVPLLAGLAVDVTRQMTAVSLDVFEIDVEGAPFRITFYPDARGVPTYGVNRAFVLTRR